jgi:nucleoside-diphosphate-sugar epimerase
MQLDGKTALVRGAARRVGRAIAEELARAGARVVIHHAGSDDAAAELSQSLPGSLVVKGDLRDPGDVRRAVEGVTYVLHQGAIPSVPKSVDDPLATNDVNVTGTLNLLVAARDAAHGAGVKRLVFASSSAVYGDAAAAESADPTKRSFVQATRSVAKHEAMTPMPLSPYAASKLIGEHYCRMFYHLYGFETVALRYFNVFGPRQNPASAYAAVVPKFIECLLEGQPPDIHGDGLQTRDFTYVADVVRANLLACEAPGEALGQVINIACHQQVSVLDLFRIIRDLVGATGEADSFAQATRSVAGVEPHHTPPRAGDVRHSFADITRARELLGYEPQWSLRDGLAKTVEHFTGRIR